MFFVKPMVSLFDPIIQADTIYLISIAGTLIGFPLVQVGYRWGKLRGNRKFTSPSIIFVGALLSVFMIGILLDLATPIVSMFLSRSLQWIILINSLSTLIFYFWFCESFGWKIKLKISGFLVVLAILNIVGWLIYLHLIGQ